MKFESSQSASIRKARSGKPERAYCLGRKSGDSTDEHVRV